MPIEVTALQRSSVPAAAFLARTLLLFHDCGRDTLFSRRRVNDVVGIALSLACAVEDLLGRPSEPGLEALTGGVARPRNPG